MLATLEEAGVEAIVNLDGLWGEELERNLDRYDRAHPGRFVTFCHVDLRAIGRPGFDAETLVESLRRSHEAGARGLKVWKDLGLGIRDASGAHVLPDDERLAPVFAAAGELGLPVLIHTADPVAFFEPADAFNERLEELTREARMGLPRERPALVHDAHALARGARGGPPRHDASSSPTSAAIPRTSAWVDRMLDDLPQHGHRRVPAHGRAGPPATRRGAPHPPPLRARALRHRLLPARMQTSTACGGASSSPTTSTSPTRRVRRHRRKGAGRCRRWRFPPTCSTRCTAATRGGSSRSADSRPQAQGKNRRLGSTLRTVRTDDATCTIGVRPLSRTAHFVSGRRFEACTIGSDAYRAGVAEAPFSAVAEALRAIR